jgi:hypothetical protein|eukprot:TRINITY_DN100_c0_g1_i1.p2 TRINITY_DN100_c0_g1~~TRINITY_DN100_c0_g1_i1.p2  ORF type:complete len:106 (-),score=53.54 TRINITY_DN100_c0_g1_i1:138-455(-)
MAKTLTLDEARAALRDVTAAFDEPENARRMTEARAAAGNDLAQMMALVLPAALEIQAGVIEKYGFERTQQSVMQFSMAVKPHEADPEVAAMVAQLKARFMPQMTK